ncbi:LLM class flavin-dependent oxidoreductase [Frankia sp. AgB1.9]|uniref:LLM class flavin-dependent oxidoreductase n=1 Tax=unclassified Frankia TaxID=2632575 RepID=UPI001932CD6B|nr:MULTISPECIES: LLM class flavin-dependent oxidoreductase [unclassified Frankia]MBL7488179.1 LLM class flavin-dependent oxidoreductase [Frankia sp. AgW1.1]MBL7553233.1 LLM class flavin-dependent oxidoreductase [Frankia sp. AgB1.9]MBL7620182.1 LLM class flavin-dependent oxidoreductase [Frankia sp. AgB1.8]
MYALRFDMRAPAGFTPAPTLYRAALEMAEWADSHGGLAITICEHHASPDGYLPAPLLMAAAVAARTKRIPIRVGAVIASLRQPVQLAEEMAVLDILSERRASFVLALGYRQVEFDLYGIPFAERVRRFEAAIETIQAAFRGEALPGVDPSVRATPAPETPGGPLVTLGGSSRAAVRRAARYGLGMITEKPGLEDAYRAACAERGIEPGPFFEAPRHAVTVAFVAPDPDAAWERLGPHLLHDAQTYARWNADAGKTGLDAIIAADDADGLRKAGHPYRVFTPDEAVEHIRTVGPLSLAPLCGGAPPELGWSTLHAIVEDVVPRVQAAAKEPA